MPRYNVQREDGKCACFSSVVDAFITPFLDEEEYENWRKEEYLKDFRPVKDGYKQTLSDTLDSLCLNKTFNEVLENLKFAGIDTPDIIKKVKEIRKQCYEDCDNDPMFYDEPEDDN